jgi:hypothetical protein
MLIDKIEEIEKEDTPEEQTVMVMSGPPTLGPEESLRLELLNLSKDILLGKAAMKWETHKQYDNVTVRQIIEEADSMFNFVMGRNESYI